MKDAVNSFIFGGKCLGKIGSLDDSDVVEVLFDVVLDESHELGSDLTEWPVEEGSDITDHVRLHTDRLTISGIITETPLLYLSPLREEGKQSRTVDALQSLETLRAMRSPFTVITGLKRYENMFFTSLTFVRGEGQGGALRFSAALAELRMVSTATTATGAAAKENTTEAGQSRKQEGKTDVKQTKKAESAPVKRDVSTLKGFAESFGYKGL